MAKKKTKGGTRKKMMGGGAAMKKKKGYGKKRNLKSGKSSPTIRMGCHEQRIYSSSGVGTSCAGTL